MYILAGSETLLASHLLPLLRDIDQVCAFDRTMGDIGDLAFIDNLLGEVKPAVFINCSELGDAEACELDREQAYALNALAAGELAARCRELGITLVQASTSYVFDGLKGAPYVEDDNPSPVQAYGDSKHLAEKLIRESGCGHLIVRFPDLFGGSGSMIHSLLDGIQTKGTVNVLKGHTVALTHARDAAHALIELMTAGARGTVHVSNSGCASMRDVIAELMGHLRRMRGAPLPFEVVECSYDDYPSAADLPLYNVLDCARYASIVKKPLRNWRDALAEFIEHHHGELV